MSNYFLRTESIKTEDIPNLKVVSDSDQLILDALTSSEPCLLEGARGSGKSFLFRLAEIELERSTSNYISVSISFSSSSLVSTPDPLQFYHWMLAKTLKAFLNKLHKRGIVTSSYATGLLGQRATVNTDLLIQNLEAIISSFELSFRGRYDGPTSELPDIEDVRDAIGTICGENGIERVYFFFDEAAHVFRPEQQRQFFTLFKELRSAYVVCNAAIYPGVTHFGSTFELTHDCIYRKLERNLSDPDYLDYFRDILFKQANDETKRAFEAQRDLLNCLVISCGGNPRVLLRTVQDLSKVNSQEVNRVLKDYYRTKIWNEHTELGEKYKGHKLLIDWGRDFLEKEVITSVEAFNAGRRAKNISESTIYFWVHKDSPEGVKESLRLLTYTGLVRKIDQGVRATRSELGDRFEIKYGCIISLDPSPSTSSGAFYQNLSLKKFVEFGRNHPSYSALSDRFHSLQSEADYLASLGFLLEKPVESLETLTLWQKDVLKRSGILSIGDLASKNEADLMDNIDGIGPARSRQIFRAMLSEVLEYLSG